VFVPCFTPEECRICHSRGTVSLVCSSEAATVVSDLGLNYLIISNSTISLYFQLYVKGVFVLKGTNLKCSSCKGVTKATFHDYIFSGYWPGSMDPDHYLYLFTDESLCNWYHTQHKQPGASENKRLQVIEEISSGFERVSCIKCNLIPEII